MFEWQQPFDGTQHQPDTAELEAVRHRFVTFVGRTLLENADLARQRGTRNEMRTKAFHEALQPLVVVETDCSGEVSPAMINIMAGDRISGRQLSSYTVADGIVRRNDVYTRPKFSDNPEVEGLSAQNSPKLLTDEIVPAVIAGIRNETANTELEHEMGFNYQPIGMAELENLIGMVQKSIPERD